MTRLAARRGDTALGPAVLISIQIEGVSTPEEFDRAVRELEFSLPGPGYGVVIEGRGPTWGYGMLVHECHPSAWVAVFDPRLGAIVVESHVPNVARGTVFPFELA